METSAKTGDNVSNVFVEIAKMLPKVEPKPANNGQTVRIDSEQQAANGGGPGCCSKN